MAAKEEDGENIKVAVRIRPLNSKERKRGTQVCWEWHEQTVSLIDGPLGGRGGGSRNDNKKKTSFTFDNLYTPSSHTSHIYRDVVAPVVRHAMTGPSSSGGFIDVWLDKRE